MSDDVLLRGFAALVSQERISTAEILAHIAEIDERRLYAPAGYPSMHAYCVDRLDLTDDAAYKRIQAARTAREFPALFHALADGRLNLSAICLQAPHLTAENVDELIAAVGDLTKSEIERLLAQRFTKKTPVACLPLTDSATDTSLAPGQVEDTCSSSTSLAPGQVEDTCSSSTSLAPGQVEDTWPDATMPTIIARVPMEPPAQEKLRRARALLSHAVPGGDIGRVFDRALDALLEKLEKRKFASTSRSQRRRRASERARCIPAHVRHEVWERDGGRCTFVSDDGHRCGSRKLLEYDHIEPVAIGGTSSVANVRLLCRTHNQLEAERRFGAGFMQQKREEAKGDAAKALARKVASAREGATEDATKTEAVAPANDDSHVRDLMAGLKDLGVRGDRARCAVDHAIALPDAALEQRMRAALRFVAPTRGVFRLGAASQPT